MPSHCVQWLTSVRRWFDAGAPDTGGVDMDRIDATRAVPFALLHLSCLAAWWTGVSPVALAVCVALYALRMFAVTAFYHRYFAHRTFKASRTTQLLFAVLAASSAQRGPLWWAAHHRSHHRHADAPQDLHSPARHAFIWSHMGWFLTRRAFATDLERVPDFAGYPELRWLDRFDMVAPLALALLCFGLGVLLAQVAPQLHTNGWQMLVWGFSISTIALFHATVSINSLAHRFGQRRYDTKDDSRNNFWLALITFGEGWHNNHHFYPGCAQQGFRPGDIDITWHGLRVLAATGVIRDLKTVPPWVLARAKD